MLEIHSNTISRNLIVKKGVPCWAITFSPLLLPNSLTLVFQGFCKAPHSSRWPQKRLVTNPHHVHLALQSQLFWGMCSVDRVCMYVYIYIYIYIYAVELKTGPRFGVSCVQNWSKSSVKKLIQVFFHCFYPNL